MRTDAELRRAIARITWFHSLELRPGIITPGHSDEHRALYYLNLPQDMTGLSVLDIGCWDGFYSFECERRGAARVVASDIWETAGREGFDLAREELGSEVEPWECSVYDLHPEQLDRFDLVLFVGVLYHLKHPLYALEKVAAMTRPGGTAIVETVIDPAFDPVCSEKKTMMFFPGKELNNDPTNWWAPNLPCLRAMLKTAGFAQVDNDISLYAVNRTVCRAVKASDEEIAVREARDRRQRYAARRDK